METDAPENVDPDVWKVQCENADPSELKLKPIA